MPKTGLAMAGGNIVDDSKGNLPQRAALLKKKNESTPNTTQ